MKANKKTLLAIALMATLGLSNGANANVIDLFNDPLANGVNTVTDSNPTSGSIVFQEYGSASSIIGGYRDIIANLVGSNGIGTPTATAEVGGGGFSFSTSSGDTGIATIQWDGQDNSASLDPTGLQTTNDAGESVGVNMIFQEGCDPTLGCDRIVADVLIADLGFEYKIGVYTDAGNFSILTANTQFAVNSPIEAEYLFTWFNLADGDYFLDGLYFNIANTGTVDFSNIGALELIVNSDGATVAVDLALDSITKTSVPEPGSLALLGLGLAAMWVPFRRRRQR